MFRTTLRATADTDVDAALADLRVQCSRAGLAALKTELIIAEVRMVLEQLVARGKELAALGSQMHVRREIAGQKFSVRLVFDEKKRRSLIEHLLSIFR
jgi:hypothetical protein